MKKNIIILLFILLGQNLLAQRYAVVKSEYTNIKETAQSEAISIDKYNENDVVDIIAEFTDEVSGYKWLLTPKGYIDANDVLQENDLPQFLNYEQIDFKKYSLQLIVYKAGVVQSLYKLRKLLINEKNIYLEKRKNVYVIYLVNIDTMEMAQAKAKEHKKNFPSLFISIPKKQKSEISETNKNIEKVVMFESKIPESNISKVIQTHDIPLKNLNNKEKNITNNNNKIEKASLIQGIENILLNY